MGQSSPASAMRRVWARLTRIRPLRDMPFRPDPRLSDGADPSGRRTDPSQGSTQDPTRDQLTSRLTRIRWTTEAGSPQLTIEGFAWRRGSEDAGDPVTDVRLDVAGEQIPFDVRPYSSGAINQFSKMPSVDRSDTGFVATLPAERLRAFCADRSGQAHSDEVFEVRGSVRITVTDRRGRLTGGFGSRDQTGSAGQLHSCDIGEGCLAQPGWDTERGLVLTLARRAIVAEAAAVSDTRLEVVLVTRGGFEPVAAELRRGGSVRRLGVQRSADRVLIDEDVSDLVHQAAGVAGRTWHLYVVDDQGRSRHVHWQGPPDQDLHRPSPADPRFAVHYGPGGVLRVDVEPVRLVVDRIRIDDADQPRLTISGESLGVPADPQAWRLIGGRVDLAAGSIRFDQTDRPGGDGRFTAIFDLVATPEWGSRPMPLATATYVLVVRPSGQGAEPIDHVRAGVEQRLTQQLPLTLETPGNQIVVRRSKAGRLELVVGPPLPKGTRSPYQRQRMETTHRTRPVRLADAVLFNSFNGNAANDNTRAVHDELLRRSPELRRLWTVADLSIEVPDGSEPVIFWTAEWWDALSTSKYLVTNCWMPTKFQRREDQQLLQTWHGTPLKLLGFDRIGTKRGDGYRDKTRREVEQWSALVAQNAYSRNIFRSAYEYHGEILEIGYPRNDVLKTADPGYVAAIRKRLGIGDDELVVLYTPTWREGTGKIFAELDLDAIQKALGTTGRLLVRGHVNTIKHSGPLDGPALLDVTMYPELSELYLISDVMITDYSSTMFDFSVTQKPMIFFVPDIDEYAGRRRGTYFDLAAEAPGPLLRTTDEVITALGRIDEQPKGYARRYAAWRQKFNPYDDGNASRRAVDALLRNA